MDTCTYWEPFFIRKSWLGNWNLYDDSGAERGATKIASFRHQVDAKEALERKLVAFRKERKG